MHRWVCAVVVVLASGLAGCGGCEGGDSNDPDTEWLSDGSGARNMSPLLPFVAGRRATNLVTDAVIEEDGRQLLRMMFQTTPINAATKQPDAMLLEKHEDGILLVGLDHARFQRPILLVPDTVRMGMRWRVNAGDFVSEFEVTQTGEERTPFGLGTWWQITEYDETGENVGSMDFLEGVGLYKLGAVFLPTVQPLDEAASLALAPVVPELPPTPLALYTLPGDWGTNLVPMTVGLVVPSGASTGTLIAKGWRSCAFADPSGHCIETTCFDASSFGAPFGPPPPRVEGYHLGDKCITHRLTNTNSPNADNGVLEVTNDASGALVLPTGVHWIPRTKMGTIEDGEDSFPLAPYADPTTQAFRMIAYSYNGLEYMDRYEWQAYPPENVSFSGTDPRLLGQWVNPVLGDRMQIGDHNPSRLATLNAPGEAPEFAVLTNHNVLLHSRIDGNTISPLVAIGAIGGSTSVTSTSAGHQLLVASPGGYIDRIVRDGSGSLAREAIGRITPPEGERVMSAIDLEAIMPGQLLITTWKPAPPDNMDVQGNHGTVRMYTTPKQTPVRWPFHPATGITAVQRVRDIVVCWPQTSEPLDTSGWSIGGVAAKQVIATSDRCALVVRDVEKDPHFGISLAGMSVSDYMARQVAIPIRWDVDGPVPGVGRVRTAVSNPGGDDMIGPNGPHARQRVAPLTGGGFTSSRRLFGPGGVMTAVPPESRTDDGFLGAADLSGAGVWVTFASGADTRFLRVGPTSTIVDVGVPVGGATRYMDPEGGLVLDANGWKRVMPDGSITTLPTPQVANLTYSMRRTTTNELCGNASSTEIVCVNGTTGVETTRITLPDNGGAIKARLPDDSLLVETTDANLVRGAVRWVPGTAPTAYDSVDLNDVTYDTDGTVYCMRDTIPGPGGTEGGICAPTGFQPLDLSVVDKASWFMANVYKDLVRIIPGPTEYFIHRFGCLQQCGTAAIRIPR